MTTAIYARISDDRRDGVGVDNQITTCREWCASEGWTPATEYIDNDVSASVYAKKPRKAFQALLRAVEAGEVERIVTFATDRLYRQPRELEVLIPLAERVEVRSKVGGLIDLSTAGGRLNARIQGALAANESDLRSERIRLAQTRARSNGDPHGGARPFGWLALDGSDRSWDPRQHDPDEAALIRQAATDVLAGARIGDIARKWNVSGVRQASGIAGRWHPTTIRGLLTSPRNAGLVTYRGDVLGPGDWPAILDRQTWERVCAELELRRARFAVVRRQQYLLSGALMCGLCGATLGHGVTRRSVIYRCHKGPGAPGCGRVQIAAEALEHDVTEALFEYVDRVRLAELLAAAGTDDPTHAASQELAQLEREAAETADLAAEGKIRPADFARYSAGLEERRRRLRGQLARISGDSALEPYAGRPGVLRAAWPGLTVPQRRGLILAGLGRLVVDSGRGRGYDFGRVRRP
ncbi:MAG: recombinase family protein [Candidatus Dormiibacterota bacterium]